MDVNSILQLKNLFAECRDGDSSCSDGEEEEGAKLSKFGPGDIKSKKAEIKNSIENPLLKKIQTSIGDGFKTMEEFEEQQKLDEDILDTRKTPDYKITYKQAVTTEDIFLQMNLKTSATSSCEDMIIEIFLPDETIGIDQMNLDVSENEVDLKTPNYRLKFSLPQKVFPSKGRAAYDVESRILKLTLRMNREFDFVNF
jgi:dynein assembly factor 6, axonemal